MAAAGAAALASLGLYSVASILHVVALSGPTWTVNVRSLVVKVGGVSAAATCGARASRPATSNGKGWRIHRVWSMAFPRAQVDVLVLAAGGVVGEAWMTGVLAGIEDESELD